MSPEFIPKILSVGMSIGKAKGSGMGVSHAAKTMEAWGGSLNMSSESTRGTTVTLNFPKIFRSSVSTMTQT